MATIYRPPGRKGYVVEWRDDGVRHRKSAGTDRRVAERIKHEVEENAALARGKDGYLKSCVCEASRLWKRPTHSCARSIFTNSIPVSPFRPRNRERRLFLSAVRIWIAFSPSIMSAR